MTLEELRKHWKDWNESVKDIYPIFSQYVSGARNLFLFLECILEDEEDLRKAYIYNAKSKKK